MGSVESPYQLAENFQSALLPVGRVKRHPTGTVQWPLLPCNVIRTVEFDCVRIHISSPYFPSVMDDRLWASGYCHCPLDVWVSEQPRAQNIRMAIKKQEFYEGAALHLLARSGKITALRYDPPFFTLNDHLLVLLKYSTRGRSPWGFTFTSDEQGLLDAADSRSKIVIGLVCGADGVAAFSYDDYRRIAAHRQSAVHVSCYRGHGEHYEISGPDGRLDRKIAPSNWRRILEP